MEDLAENELLSCLPPSTVIFLTCPHLLQLAFLHLPPRPSHRLSWASMLSDFSHVSEVTCPLKYKFWVSLALSKKDISMWFEGDPDPLPHYLICFLSLYNLCTASSSGSCIGHCWLIILPCNATSLQPHWIGSARMQPSTVITLLCFHFRLLLTTDQYIVLHHTARLEIVHSCMRAILLSIGTSQT